MFRNAPEIQPQGRYYFNDTAPHYPGIHVYGSLNWQAGEIDVAPPLGEVLGAARPWNNGAAPERRALPQIIGTGDCLQNGATYPVPADPPIVIENGIDSRCFVPVVSDVLNQLSALNSPALNAAYARLVELVYDEDFLTVAQALFAWFGAKFVGHSHASAGQLPARYYAIFDDGVVFAIVSGTSTFQQFAEQALTALVGPTEQGAYATIPLWNNTASHVAQELAALGVVDVQPLVLLGHSYGAAVCTLFAGRCRLAAPARDITLAAYALPKPGDERAVSMVADVRAIFCATEEDLVVALPPGALELVPFTPLLPAGLLALWSLWQRMPSYLVVDELGGARIGAPQFLTYPALLPIITDAIAGNPQASIAAHAPAVYRERLLLRQPTPAWPVPAAAWAVLFP